jgi:hypothetical protein
MVRIASFLGPAVDFRSRFMESSMFKGYANPIPWKFQFHLKQDNGTRTFGAAASNI